MSRIVLEHGGLRVVIDPALGAGITDLSWRLAGRGMTALMRPAPERTKWFNDLACYLLAPWSNRVAGAEFAWRGAKQRLQANWPDGTAIHGLVKDRPWRVERRSADSAVLGCEVEAGAGGFAWAFAARAEYEVRENSLAVRLEVRNEGGGPRANAMPVGLGFHPFWRTSLDGGADEAVVRVPGLARYPCESMIPVGAARTDEVTAALAAGMPARGVMLDDVFAGSSHGAEVLWERSGVRVRYRCSEELGHTVVFTEMPGSFCLEPVTMVNDGFNLESRGCAGSGVLSLARGEAARAEWRVEIDRV